MVVFRVALPGARWLGCAIALAVLALAACSARWDVPEGLRWISSDGSSLDVIGWVPPPDQTVVDPDAAPDAAPAFAVETLYSPLDWLAVVHRAVTEDEILLQLEPGAPPRAVPAAQLSFDVAPLWLDDNDTTLRDALAQFEQGETKAGEASLRRLARTLGGPRQRQLEGWLSLVRYQRVDRQTMLLDDRALAKIESALVRGSAAHFWALIELASRATERGHLATAARLVGALEVFDDHLPQPQLLARAWLQYVRGDYDFESKDFEAAHRKLAEALGLAETAGDQGLLRARIWIKLGAVQLTWSNLEKAEGFFLQAKDAIDRAGIEGPLLSLSLSGLARCKMRRGRPDEVRSSVERALRIGRRTGGILEAKMRINYCNLLTQGGEVREARRQIDRATEIIQRVSPDSHWEALALTIRSTLAASSWELDQALADVERAAMIRNELAPQSLARSSSLIHLGELALTAGDLDKAAFYLNDALALDHRLTSRRLMRSIINLGRLAQMRGDYARAEELQREALDYYAINDPGPRELGSTLRHLGLALAGQERWSEAEAAFEEAVRLTSELKLDSARVISMVSLSRIYAVRGELDKAQESCLKSMDQLEAEATVATTPLARGGFLDQYDASYRDCIAYHVQDDQLSVAFSLLERYRARQFLDSLAERDLLFSAQLPPALAQRRAEVAQRLDRLMGQLNRAASGDELSPLKMEQLELKLTETDRERIAIQEQIRAQSPEFAALESPRPLSSHEAAEVLTPGTLVASYSVGKDYSLVFALDAEDRLCVHRIDISRQDLYRKVESLRELIRQARPDLSIGAVEARRLAGLATELYDLLLAPIQLELNTAERLLVLPDGPLALLPFAALHDGERYLVEQLPISSAPSISVYQQLRKQGSSSTGLTLLALGAPHYSSTDGDLSLSELPYSEQEVAHIAELFPAGRSRALLGALATEENFKQSAPDAQVIHLSAHGFVDDRYPLSSGLALSSVPEQIALEGGEDGSLLAREIFEEVRLHCDLVVLSACETGLGALASGEGLVGLTRAFQYAGARSVVASLWRISDEVTSRLMVEFYRLLVAGRPIDEALQRAQIAILRKTATTAGGDTSAPYYWAAFQLTGRAESLRLQFRSAHGRSLAQVPRAHLPHPDPALEPATRAGRIPR